MIAVDFLPLPGEARANIIYIVKSTNLEYITYKNDKWFCLNDSNEDVLTGVLVVDTLPALHEAEPNINRGVTGYLMLLQLLIQLSQVHSKRLSARF